MRVRVPPAFVLAAASISSMFGCGGQVGEKEGNGVTSAVTATRSIDSGRPTGKDMCAVTEPTSVITDLPVLKPVPGGDQVLTADEKKEFMRFIELLRPVERQPIEHFTLEEFANLEILLRRKITKQDKVEIEQYVQAIKYRTWWLLTAFRAGLITEEEFKKILRSTENDIDPETIRQRTFNELKKVADPQLFEDFINSPVADLPPIARVSPARDTTPAGDKPRPLPANDGATPLKKQPVELLGTIEQATEE